MPQCAFKNCKNNHRNSRVSDGISFFSFPNNPFRCEEWIAVVARERKDAFYKPSRRSVICSIHFEKCDISENKKRQRLVSTAVPKLQIEPVTDEQASTRTRRKRKKVKPIISPLIKIEYTEEVPVISVPIKKETTEDDPGISPRIKIEIDEENPAISQPIKKEITDNDQVISSRTEIEINEDDPVILPQIKKERTEEDPLNTICHQDTPKASISDLIPISETPKESYLKKQLNKCRQIIIDKSRKIQNLQKANKRLLKNNDVLKNQIKILQKKKKIGNNILGIINI